jgi:hypothetical protein
MNIKQMTKICLQILIVMSLLIANTSIAAAGGGKGDDYVGQVSTSDSDSLPIPTAKELEKLGLSPDASQSLPGGGTATATAQLAWNSVRMDGIATSSLSSNTLPTYYLCARVVQLYMNSAPQGGTTYNCGYRTGGGSVSRTKSKVVTSVYGKTWRVDTAHEFSKTGYSWYPTLTVSVSL